MFRGSRERFPGGNSVIDRCFLLDLRPKGKSRTLLPCRQGVQKARQCFEAG
jgi:hypothetical protein